MKILVHIECFLYFLLLKVIGILIFFILVQFLFHIEDFILIKLLRKSLLEQLRNLRRLKRHIGVEKFLAVKNIILFWFIILSIRLDLIL